MSTLSHLASHGLLGADGVQAPIQWAELRSAEALGAQILAGQVEAYQEVVRNPHHGGGWARDVVRSPRLLAAVWSVLGPAVAVENTFLVVKWPGREFVVPWHQDGIDERIELDPGRAVSAWLALSDATVDNGCLEVVPGSQTLGYLPYEQEPITGAPRGRAGQAGGFAAATAVPVPLAAGQALLMDVRLLHRSTSNIVTNGGARVGLNVRYVAPGGVRTRDYSSSSVDPISGSGW